MPRYQATLTGAADRQEAICRCDTGQAVSLKLVDDAAGWVVLNADGEELGALRASSILNDVLEDGAEIKSAIVLSVNEPKVKQAHRTLTIRVECDEDVEADAAEHEVRSYKVGIVGESNYQAAIRRCRLGELVRIEHETGNPYDVHALAVVSSVGEPIGYIGRDSWVRAAVHDEGKGCTATIMSIADSGGRGLGVVLDLALAPGPIAVRSFSYPAPAARSQDPIAQQPTKQKGWLARLFGL